MTQPATTGVSPNGASPKVTVEFLVQCLKGLQQIDQWKFKVGEYEDLEDETGRPVTSQIGSPAPAMWFMRGTLWLALRRQHPHIAYDDLRQLDMETISEAFASGSDDDEGGGLDPPSGNDDASSEPPDAVSEPASSPASATSGG